MQQMLSSTPTAARAATQPKPTETPAKMEPLADNAIEMASTSASQKVIATEPERNGTKSAEPEKSSSSESLKENTPEATEPSTSTVAQDIRAGLAANRVVSITTDFTHAWRGILPPKPQNVPSWLVLSALEHNSFRPVLRAARAKRFSKFGSNTFRFR